MIWIVLFLCLAVALMLAEIFWLPGVTVFGVFSALFMIAAVYIAYTQLGISAGHKAATAALVLSVVGVGLGFRYIGRADIGVQATIDGRVNEQEDFALGQKGIAISDLRPGGKAQFNDKIVEVRSEGPYIEAGSEIEIIAIDQSRWLVQKV